MWRSYMDIETFDSVFPHFFSYHPKKLHLFATVYLFPFIYRARAVIFSIASKYFLQQH
jgi:hypothetical protein